jgi:hypothetical protein
MCVILVVIYLYHFSCYLSVRLSVRATKGFPAGQAIAADHWHLWFLQECILWLHQASSR